MPIWVGRVEAWKKVRTNASNLPVCSGKRRWKKGKVKGDHSLLPYYIRPGYGERSPDVILETPMKGRML